MPLTLEELAESCTDMMSPEIARADLEALFADAATTPDDLMDCLEDVLGRLENLELLSDALKVVNEDARYTPVFAWLAEALDEDTVGYLLDDQFFPVSGRGQTTFLRTLSNLKRLRGKDAQTLLEPLGEDVWGEHQIDLALSIIVREERSEHRAVRKILEAEIRSGRVPVSAADRRALQLLATDPPEHREPMLKLMGQWQDWAPAPIGANRDGRVAGKTVENAPVPGSAPNSVPNSASGAASDLDTRARGRQQ